MLVVPPSTDLPSGLRAIVAPSGEGIVVATMHANEGSRISGHVQLYLSLADAEALVVFLRAHQPEPAVPISAPAAVEG